MRHRFRILDCKREDLFTRGDTLTIGRGGVLLPTRVRVPDGCCLEVLLFWPDNRCVCVLADVVGSIVERHRRLLAVKLHRVQKEIHQETVKYHAKGDWLI